MAEFVPKPGAVPEIKRYPLLAETPEEVLMTEKFQMFLERLMERIQSQIDDFTKEEEGMRKTLKGLIPDIAIEKGEELFTDFINNWKKELAELEKLKRKI